MMFPLCNHVLNGTVYTLFLLNGRSYYLVLIKVTLHSVLGRLDLSITH